MNQPAFHTYPLLPLADRMIASRKPRILVVEDDDLLRDLHATCFHLEDYDVETARDGIEALHKLSESKFDLIVTDGNMPRLDGVNLIRTIRASGNRIPVIMVSASLNYAALPADVAKEVCVALPKPARINEILGAASYALGHAIPV